MLMNSTENPPLPCEVEKADLDFEGIAREIAGQQEAVKKSMVKNMWQLRREPVFNKERR